MAKAFSSGQIIISYRRTESAAAGRIMDQLVEQFGDGEVFIDVDDIPYGVDFRQQISDAFKSGELLLAVVGKKWLGPCARGKHRIHDKADPVRVEIETAIRRRITILPVLVDHASMPGAHELPECIREFAYRNAAVVDSGPDFHYHIKRLIESIEEILTGHGSKTAASTALVKTSSPPSPTPLQLVFKSNLLRYALVALLGAFAVIALAHREWVWKFGDQASAGRANASIVGDPGPASRMSGEVADSDPMITATQEAPTTPPAGQTNDFCEDLQRVVAAFPDQLDTLLKQKTASNWWPALKELPGWDECGVEANPGKPVERHYSCVQGLFASDEETNTPFKALGAAVQSCLGPSWTKRYSPHGKRLIFAAGNTDTLVELGPEEYPAGWLLKLEVQLPEK